MTFCVITKQGVTDPGATRGLEFSGLMHLLCEAVDHSGRCDLWKATQNVALTDGPRKFYGGICTFHEASL
jgi:hypothetical protein